MTPKQTRRAVATAYVEAEEAYDRLVLSVARRHGYRVAWNTPHDKLVTLAETPMQEAYREALTRLWSAEAEASDRGHAYREGSTTIKVYADGRKSRGVYPHQLVDEFPSLARRLEKSRAETKRLAEQC